MSRSTARVALAFAVSVSAATHGVAAAQQTEPASGLVALHQALLDASTDVVVLNVAAHPDDESSRTNTILRRKHGMRVVTVYSTYGDGGQNAIGREIGPELAGLRVRETLRAAAMSGVDVRWLGMEDFGFSKTLDETLRVWGADALRDAMRAVVDAVDPDVVITNHSLTQGHGHHRASFWAIREVLQQRAAAGRRAPPLLARCGVEQAQLVLDPNELDPARGETWARLAHRAWTQHVTQGPWGPHNPLQVGKDFWRVAFPENGDAVAAADPMRWGREQPRGAGLPANAPTLPREQLATLARERLVALRGELKAVVADLAADGALRRARLLRQRCGALERVLLALANVRVETWLERDQVPLGGNGKAFVVVHGHERVQRLAVRCGDGVGEQVQTPVRPTPFDGATPAATPTAGAASPTLPVPSNGALVTPGTAEPSGTGSSSPDVAAKPDVLPPPLPGRFAVTFDGDGDVDDDPPAGPEPAFADVMVEFELDGLPFVVVTPLAYDVVAGIELACDREVLLVQRGTTVQRTISVSITSHTDSEPNAPVRLSMGPGISATSMPGRLGLTREHAEARVLVRAEIVADELMPDAGILVAFRGASVRLPVRVVDVAVPPGMKVALVRGPDDTTERALADLGVPFDVLDRDGLLGAELDDYSAVLLDIRAYHHRPELAEMRDRLLQYCRAGGRIVAMYHKPGEWNERAGRPLLAPFPLVVGDERATEEDGPVAPLQPEHPLLQRPHVLGAADFAGWVQERGLNFPKTWDTAWTPLLATKDSGDEKPHHGALLHTQYGRGDFVYCSLALYRQLRVGNAGAARLLVNLLAR
jgi:LmbE family N-acetylglucosaminyl deacetylase